MAMAGVMAMAGSISSRPAAATYVEERGRPRSLILLLLALCCRGRYYVVGLSLSRERETFTLASLVSVERDGAQRRSITY